MNAPNVHDLMIDRNDDTGDYIAGCWCGWFDDKCYSLSDAVRRYEAHCDRELSRD